MPPGEPKGCQGRLLLPCSRRWGMLQLARTLNKGAASRLLHTAPCGRGSDLASEPPPQGAERRANAAIGYWGVY